MSTRIKKKITSKIILPFLRLEIFKIIEKTNRNLTLAPIGESLLKWAEEPIHFLLVTRSSCFHNSDNYEEDCQNMNMEMNKRHRSQTRRKHSILRTIN